MTAVLESPPDVAVASRPPARGRTAVLVAVLLVAALALLAVAALRAAPGLTRFDAVAPTFGGDAPEVTLPGYGPGGTHIVGYEHGTTSVLSLPLRNDGLLPVTVTSVDLGGGVAPLLAVREVRGLPLSLGPGETGTVEVSAEVGNCRYFHEREAQIYDGVTLGFSALGQDSRVSVPFDRRIMVHAPMIVGCPDGKLNRETNNRRGLSDAA